MKFLRHLNLIEDEDDKQNTPEEEDETETS